MNPSLGLVFGLFLLAPGLGFFAGVFLGEHRGGVQPAPPPPGSLTALVLVGMSTLAAHAVGALALLALIHLGVPHRLFAIGSDLAHGTLDGPADVAAFLAYLIALSALGYAAGRLLYLSSWIRRSLYGWLAQSIEKSRAPNRYVVAHVLSAIEANGARLGYQGFVENVMLDSDREIESIVLVDVNRFTLRLSERGLVHTRPHGGPPLQRLHLDHTQIGNIVFDVLALADDGNPAPALPERGLWARGLSGLARLRSGTA